MEETYVCLECGETQEAINPPTTCTVTNQTSTWVPEEHYRMFHLERVTTVRNNAREG